MWPCTYLIHSNIIYLQLITFTRRERTTNQDRLYYRRVASSTSANVNFHLWTTIGNFAGTNMRRMSKPNASRESVVQKLFWFAMLTKSSILLVFILALHFPLLPQHDLWYIFFPSLRMMFTRMYKNYLPSRRSSRSTSIKIGICKFKFTSNWNNILTELLHFYYFMQRYNVPESAVVAYLKHKTGKCDSPISFSHRLRLWAQKYLCKHLTPNPYSYP